MAKPENFVDHWVGVLVIACVCLLPLFLLLWGVHWLIPIPMAVDAASRFDPNPVTFKANLEDEERGNIRRQHREALRHRGVPEDAIRDTQWALWVGWPMIVLAGLLLYIIGVRALAHSYVAYKKEAEANDSCPPGGAGSYVGMYIPEMPPGHGIGLPLETELGGMSQRRRGHRTSSSRDFRHHGCVYERIAVLRDDIAHGCLHAIASQGPVHVIRGLAEDLHEPGHHELGETPWGGPAFDDDQMYEERGYVLVWNMRRGYISLAFEVEAEAPVTE